MVVTDVARAALMFATAVVIWQGWSAYVVYALVALSTIVGTAFRPAQAALLPNLARTPSELTAANVSSSTLEAFGAFAGPALGGVVSSPSPRSRPSSLSMRSRSSGRRCSSWPSAAAAGRGGKKGLPTRRSPATGDGLAAGFRAIFSGRDLVVLAGLYTAQTLVAGALNVLVVVTRCRLLDLRELRCRLPQRRARVGRAHRRVRRARARDARPAGVRLRAGRRPLRRSARAHGG